MNEVNASLLIIADEWEQMQVLIALQQFAGMDSNPPALSPAYSALAQDPRTWLDISPGPNLEGWQEYPWPPGNQDLNALPQEPTQWHMDVKTGTLLCDGTTHTQLLTKTMYKDFVLQVEWRFLEPVEHYNSGVFVRMQPGQRVMHQIETRSGKVGVIMGGTLVEGDLTYLGVIQPGRSGRWKAVWPHIPQRWRQHVSRRKPTPLVNIPQAFGPSVPTVVHPPGAWNTYEITCIGKTIVVRTNNTVSSITNNCTVMAGAVGFESEGYAIAFRNIRLKFASVAIQDHLAQLSPGTDEDSAVDVRYWRETH